MLSNQNITLRAVEPEDLGFLYRIENEPSLWRYSARKEPFSRYILKQYIEDCDKSVFERGQLRFIITENAENQTIGTIDIYDFDYHNKKAETGVFIEQKYSGKGYATQAINLLAKYAKEFLNLHQLYAYADMENYASRKFLQKAGFKHTATLKDWYLFNGKFQDIALFQLEIN